MRLFRAAFSRVSISEEPAGPRERLVAALATARSPTIRSNFAFDTRRRPDGAARSRREVARLVRQGIERRRDANRAAAPARSLTCDSLRRSSACKLNPEQNKDRGCLVR